MLFFIGTSPNLCALLIFKEHIILRIFGSLNKIDDKFTWGK